MQIRVGIKTGDLIQLDHRAVTIVDDAHVRRTYTASGSVITVKDGSGSRSLGNKASVKPTKPAGILSLSSAAAGKGEAKTAHDYRGVIELTASGNNLRVVLISDLEHYVQGVLQSEVPSYFKLEAMKAQAVLARTYGLRPRVPHNQDGFDVCDSFLHCQAFYGVRTLTAMQQQAISSTAGQLLMYDGKPALALFSACAGGHTEDYENCFSDPVTNAFPPPAIPYLRGVPEGQLPAGYPSEKALRQLFALRNPKTDDAWSMSHFRWRITLSADSIEAHMHHIVEKLQEDPQFCPFIKPPKSGKFGHIKGFEIVRRGVAGTAIEMLVKTSEGNWSISKELTIRSAFENPEAKLKRLRSARLYFDYNFDSLGLLSKVTISGFGSGHGVGLQQVGAEGLAREGKNYRQIIAHYYKGASVGAHL
jgi:SpoIID/LytB domain protein